MYGDYVVLLMSGEQVNLFLTVLLYSNIFFYVHRYAFYILHIGFMSWSLVFLISVWRCLADLLKAWNENSASYDCIFSKNLNICFDSYDIIFGKLTDGQVVEILNFYNCENFDRTKILVESIDYWSKERLTQLIVPSGNWKQSLTFW